jgi:hypothetical protein
VGPGLPQSCSPFFSIRRYTPPILYAQGSNILPHTFFPSQSWSSHFNISFWFRNQHLQVNNILVHERFGFRKDLSTDHADFSLTTGILQAWNDKLQTAEIFCDLAKAFALIMR